LFKFVRADLLSYGRMMVGDADVRFGRERGGEGFGRAFGTRRERVAE
jgi:hypothetical protein